MSDFLECIKKVFIADGGDENSWDSKVEDVSNKINEGIREFQEKLGFDNISPDIDIADIYKKNKAIFINLLNQIVEVLKDKVKEISTSINDVSDKIEQTGGWKSFVCTAWNVSECKTAKLNQADVIKWMKENLDTIKKYSGCLYCKEDGIDSKFLVHIFFLDENNKPLLNGAENPHRIIHTDELDLALKNALGTKNMIIYK